MLRPRLIVFLGTILIPRSTPSRLTLATVHQDILPNGHVVDIGPNWIHGTDHNPILELAKKTNSVTHSWQDDADNLFDEHGKPVKNPAEVSEKFWATIMKAFRYSEKHSVTIDPQRSLWDFFLEETAQMSKTTEEREQAKLILQFAEMWGAFIGTPITCQSLKFFWLEECIDGGKSFSYRYTLYSLTRLENLFCASTYQSILAEISKPAKEHAAIHFNTKVDGVDTHCENPIIHTKDGQSFHFDEVVVTAPLGWLKKNKGVFSPELPNRLTKAMDAIGYGNLEKVGNP